MRRALALAEAAAAHGEAPVGAVLLDPAGEELAAAHNTPIAGCDPTAHAEILALRAGASRLGNYRLVGATMVVTLEPCLMCVGALVHARVARVVFGAHDPKAGAVSSQLEGFALPFLNHRVTVVGGVLAEACGDILRRFFQARRGG